MPTAEPVPEVDMYFRLLMMHHFETSPSMYRKVLDLTHQNVEKMLGAQPSEYGPHRGQVWYALERTYQLGSASYYYSSPFNTPPLYIHADKTQASLISRPLRSYYIHNSPYDQAYNRRFTAHPTLAPGFYQAVHKLFVVVELLMATSPTAAVPPPRAREAVRTSSLSQFQTTLAKHTLQFEADCTFTLIYARTSVLVKCWSGKRIRGKVTYHLFLLALPPYPTFVPALVHTAAPARVHPLNVPVLSRTPSHTVTPRTIESVRVQGARCRVRTRIRRALVYLCAWLPCPPACACRAHLHRVPAHAAAPTRPHAPSLREPSSGFNFVQNSVLPSTHTPIPPSSSPPSLPFSDSEPAAYPHRPWANGAAADKGDGVLVVCPTLTQHTGGCHGRYGRSHNVTAACVLCGTTRYTPRKHRVAAGIGRHDVQEGAPRTGHAPEQATWTDFGTPPGELPHAAATRDQSTTSDAGSRIVDGKRRGIGRATEIGAGQE
ncbi:hypothetical protein C8F04DRAFT_1279200 [Mycena alexandri]|uniref:Uncharacterized protein n=2 Tax=Mycena alexandri TaxID=1745969 RepID=A0AAD6RYM1_9AGAR|nr:hypothetical protein C8F04DRAFT_1279200 [Mycena alexandri]